MKRLLAAVDEVLETEVPVTADACFREVPGWCSLKAFGLLVMLENDFGAPVDLERLAALKTVRDLALEVVAAAAAQVFKVPRERLSAATRFGELPEWDSVNHLRLVMEVERRLGAEYPLERIPELRQLGDFVA